MSLEHTINTDKNTVMQTYARYPVEFVRGKGAKLYDSDGKEYIDFSSGIGVSSLGYGDKAWADAVAAQAKTLAHTSNLYYNPLSTALAEQLTKLAGFGAKAFFGNSGAEANEGMIKLARKYSRDRRGDGHATILTLKNSFHGRTITTLAATGQDAFHTNFYPFTEGFKYAAPDMDDIRAAASGDVCAVMFECIQGEGGVLPLDMDFVRNLCAFAREKGWLVLIDEVQTGVGRTGTMFCFEQYGVKPDAFTLAKGLGGGLPVGAIVAFGAAAETLDAGTHASTFGANPVMAAGALEVLKRVSDPVFLAEVKRKGQYIKNRLTQPEMPKCAVRGMGMMFGIDIEGVDSKEAVKVLLQNGLVALTAKNAVRFLPPLTINDNELEEGMNRFIKTIQSMKG